MKPGSQPFASFPEWARVVGGIMENAGLGTPMSNDLQNDVGGDTETKSMKVSLSVATQSGQSRTFPSSK